MIKTAASIMGKKILAVCVFAFLLVVWSSFIVGVESSSLSRPRRQSADSGNDATDNPFGEEIYPERGSPPEPEDNAASDSGVVPAAAPSSQDNTTATLTPTTTLDTTPASAANTTASDQKEDGDNTVTVTVVIVILVIALVLGVAVFIYLRIRKKRMADYEKKAQIQMMSATSAGVYVDLTSAPPEDKEVEKDKGDNPETECLKKDHE